MKITIAIDSMKGSLTSLEAGYAAAEGIRRVYPEANTIVLPLADGGEGTAEALTACMGGALQHIKVTGPLGEPAACCYGIVAERKLAIMEAAGAAGLALVPENMKNPLYTTTYGIGEMILDAVRKGCRHFLVGIGGSATNDGGIGMLQALGFGMLNGEGKQVVRGAKGLAELAQITDAGVTEKLKACTFRVACDVENPLCGKNGCSAVYGPQKGADAETIRQMDAWLRHYAALAKTAAADADAEFSGAGAAGGLGFAFRTFLHAALESGAQIVMEETHLEEAVKTADFVITGEGCLDGQTAMGKAPVGVARLAKKWGRTVLAFSGAVKGDVSVCYENGIDACFPILRSVVSLEEAMDKETAKKNMRETAEQVFRLIRICEGGRV